MVNVTIRKKSGFSPNPAFVKTVPEESTVHDETSRDEPVTARHVTPMERDTRTAPGDAFRPLALGANPLPPHELEDEPTERSQSTADIMGVMDRGESPSAVPPDDGDPSSTLDGFDPAAPFLAPDESWDTTGSYGHRAPGHARFPQQGMPPPAVTREGQAHLLKPTGCCI